MHDRQNEHGEELVCSEGRGRGAGGRGGGEVGGRLAFIFNVLRDLSANENEVSGGEVIGGMALGQPKY